MWLGCGAVIAALVMVTGVAGSPTPGVRGVESLGPDTGASVSGYLADAAARLGEVGADEQRWALLSPQVELTAESAARLVDGARTARVLLRVRLPRVQTALLTAEIADQGGPDALVADLTAAQRRAAGRLAAVQQVSAGRERAVAEVSVARLSAGCACVVGLLLRGSGAQLRAVAGRSGVRALAPAPAGAGYGDLALAPLLPAQSGTVGPGPDDGTVPRP